MPARTGSTARQRRGVERRAEPGTRILAKRYVATVSGKPSVASDSQSVYEVFTGRNKGETFAKAKRYARDHTRPGSIVELRKDSTKGGIIERVVLDVNAGNGYWVRWKQDFGT